MVFPGQCVIVCSLIFLTQSQQIDPFAMNLDLPETLSNTPHISKDIYKSCEIQTTRDNNADCNVYLKRIVRLILNSAQLDTSLPVYQGSIKINISPEDYDILHKLAGSAVLDLTALKQLDYTLSEAFKKPLKDRLDDLLSSGLDKLVAFTTSNVVIYFASLCLLLCVFYMLRHSFTIGYMVTYIIFIFWLIDFGVKWTYLSEEYTEHNIKVITSGEQCDYRGLWGHWQYMWGTVDCNKKILSPFVVLEEQFRHIVGPMKYFGMGLGAFSHHLLTEMPWFLSIVLFPVMLIFTLFLICIFLSFLADVPIKLNVLHLATLQFGRERGNMIEEGTRNRNLNVGSQTLVQGTGGGAEDRSKAIENKSPVEEVERIEDVKDEATKEVEDCKKPKEDHQVTERGDEGDQVHTEDKLL